MEKIRVALEHPSEAESLMVPDHLFGAKSLSAEALEAYLGQIKHANSMSKYVKLHNGAALLKLFPMQICIITKVISMINNDGDNCLISVIDYR